MALLFRGYHPGAEDDGVYLAAIKHDLNPHLFPHDAAFFVLQSQATIFDRTVALSQRATGLPLAWCILLWQFLAIAVLLFGCKRLIQRCFKSRAAQWSGVAALSLLSAMSVAGAALYITDEHLHPRLVATALIVHAVVEVLDRRLVKALLLLMLAIAFHPIMAAFGLTYCSILVLRPLIPAVFSRVARACVFAMPTWVVAPTNSAWREAVTTRHYYFLNQWAWYEHLGYIGPFLIFLWLAAEGRRSNSFSLTRLSESANLYGMLHLSLAILVVSVPAFARALPWQPMRYLHLQYVLMIVLCFAVLGERWLRTRPLHWAAVFVPLAAIMFIAERRDYPNSPHVEWPGRAHTNEWLQAFDWIRQHTPTDAYFAIDPDYLRSPGEEFRGFRALAERSVLADEIKDAAVVTQVPGLAPQWQEQVAAQRGIDRFGPTQFKQLHERFGVDWVLLQNRADRSLDCPYQKDSLAVCRIASSETAH